MSIPDEVIESAFGEAWRVAPGKQSEFERFAAGVIAEWARREALQPVISYLNHCRILRVEPTTAGLTNALPEGEQA